MSVITLTMANAKIRNTPERAEMFDDIGGALYRFINDYGDILSRDEYDDGFDAELDDLVDGYAFEIMGIAGVE